MPSLGPDVARARFESALRSRRVQGAEADGEVSLWLHRDGVSDRPGVSANLWLEAPDAFRMRVDGVFGAAVEAAARGDSLVVHAPVWKIGVVSDEASDPGGFGSAGSVVWSVLSGSLSPPDSAWRGARTADSATVVSWRLGGEAVTLTIAPDGLPARATVEGPGHTRWIARYERWQAFDRVMWPSHVVLGDVAGRTRATLKVQSMRIRPRGVAPLVRLRPPPRALHVTRREGIELLEQLAREGEPAVTDSTSR